MIYFIIFFIELFQSYNSDREFDKLIQLILIFFLI